VKSAQRSGTWLALVGIRRCNLVESGGRLSSKASAMPHTMYRTGGENASEASQIATPTL
jgi:hypothetical protein